MSAPETDELEKAVRSLEGLPRRAKPSRHHAREVLLALGARIEEEGEAATRDRLDRIRRATERFGASWPAAVLDELTLACTEHARSVDPRFLSLPDYDLEYTLEARERLETRLAAVRALGLGVAEHLLVQVRKADRLLADHLSKLGFSPPPSASQEEERNET